MREKVGFMIGVRMNVKVKSKKFRLRTWWSEEKSFVVWFQVGLQWEFRVQVCPNEIFGAQTL